MTEALPAARLAQGDTAVDDFCGRWPRDFTQCMIGRPASRLAAAIPTQREWPRTNGAVCSKTSCLVPVVKENLWQDGGCIAQFSFEGDTRMANAEAVFDEWRRLLG